MALQGSDEKEITNAVRSLLKACILSDGIDVDKLAPFDLEWLFLRIRGKSVGETVEARLNIDSATCGKNEACKLDIEVNLDDVQVVKDTKHTSKIMLTDKVGLVLTYPTSEMIANLKEGLDKIEIIMEVIYACVATVFNGDEVYVKASYDGEWDADVRRLLDNLTRPQMELIRDFFRTMPKLRLHVEQKCPKCEKVITRDIEGIMDFFS